MINCVLVKYGEIAIRGKNRDKHELMLINKIKTALNSGYTVKREQGRFLIESGALDLDYVLSKVTKVPGVHSVCPCVKMQTSELPVIYNAAVEYIRAHYSDESFSFKVKTKRANKQYERSSDNISADIGAIALSKCGNLSVDVHDPDFILYVELRNFVYIYSKQYMGFGGLPVSSSGRAAYLLSGGIDSPVAAFVMGKRGVYGEFVYFHTPPYVGSAVKQKVIDLSCKVCEYIGPSKLHVVNFSPVSEYLQKNVPMDKLTVFMKRSMLSIAEMVAHKEKMLALVVGDSVGQVASQTLAAINAIDSAVNMPVLRPFAGNNKQEIIDLAKRIGTFDISVLPYEDCCTVFTAKHPETRPKKSVIEAIECSLSELAQIKISAFESLETIEVGYGR